MAIDYKNRNDVLSAIGAEGLTQKSLSRSLETAKKKGVLGTSISGVSDNTSSAINSGAGIVNPVAKKLQTIAFGTDSFKQGTNNNISSSSNNAAQGATSTVNGNEDASGSGAIKNSPTAAPVTPTVFKSGTTSISQTGIPNSFNNVDLNPRAARLGTNSNTLNFDNGVGGSGSITSNRTFTPEQQSSLAKTLEFNSRQSTKDMFARDAKVVNDREAAYKASLGQGGVGGNRQVYEANLQDAYARGDKTGIAINLKLLQATDKNNVDIQQSKLAADVSNATNQRALLGAANEAAFKANKFESEQNTASVNLIKDLSDKGAVATQILPAIRQATGKVTLGNLSQVFGNDETFNTLLASKDKKGLNDYFAKQGIQAEDLSDAYDELFK